MRRKILPWLCGTAALGVMLLGPGVASAAARDVCKGTGDKPGVLVGYHRGDVVVHGTCVVSAGPAEVHGTLTVGEDSTLLAAFGLHDSHLTVDGNLRVERGASVILGCKVNPDGTGFACIDDPNPKAPTLTSHGAVGGSLIEDSPLGVVVHNSSIGGSVIETGGGGGFTCNPLGVFAKFKSPVYSNVEDSTIGGSLVIEHLTSCWLGVARVQIGGAARFLHNQLADPDAIEILDNHIHGDLACFDNSVVWDTADEPPLFAVFPRIPEPNTVDGKRLGQCVLQSRTTDKGSEGPGPF